MIEIELFRWYLSLIRIMDTRLFWTNIGANIALEQMSRQLESKYAAFL